MHRQVFDFEEEPRVDLTPLVDVIFLLLIFFIMTTTFSRPVLDIILPQSEQAEVSADRQPQVISVKMDGTLHYEGRQIEQAELPAILDEKPEALLELHVDHKAPFEAFVGVVDVAKVRKGGRFVISTQPPQNR